MSNSILTFPLRGVIGIVDASADQLQLAIDSQLHCVEIRADLLRTAGLTDQEILSVVSTAKAKGLATLFTLRHADQGGTFNSSESIRVSMCEQALEAGADMIDLEYGTDAASKMLLKAAPMILSYHNFKAMLNASELSSLSDAMQALAPAAIKVIPTGQSIQDAATMLSWVAGATEEVKRIGFAMGHEGGVSRILTLAQGAPVTYASFGDPVAPGQIDIKHLLNRYHCNEMSTSTKIIAVVGEPSAVESYAEQSIKTMGTQLGNRVWIGFDTKDHDTVKQLASAMGISAIERV